MSRSNLFIFSSELTDARKCCVRLFLLASPFLIAASAITLIDPYNFFWHNQRIPDEIKRPVALQIDPPFWKLNEFEKDPKQFILFGDSRMAAIPTERIKDLSGDDYANLSYGGASLREMIDTFWFVAARVQVKKVYFGVNLGTYNDYDVTDRLAFYKASRESPLLYTMNKGVWEAAFYDLKGYFTGARFMLGTPTAGRDQFWNEQLQLTATYYKKYAEPVKYRTELKSISDYCRGQGIELKFVILPTHVDAQREIVNANFQSQNEALRTDLMSFGDVYDFDWPSDLTNNPDNFSDPLHLDHKSIQSVMQEVWRGVGTNCRFLPYRPR